MLWEVQEVLATKANFPNRIRYAQSAWSPCWVAHILSEISRIFFNSIRNYYFRSLISSFLSSKSSSSSPLSEWLSASTASSWCSFPMTFFKLKITDFLPKLFAEFLFATGNRLRKGEAGAALLPPPTCKEVLGGACSPGPNLRAPSFLIPYCF